MIDEHDDNNERSIERKLGGVGQRGTDRTTGRGDYRAENQPAPLPEDNAQPAGVGQVGGPKTVGRTASGDPMPSMDARFPNNPAPRPDHNELPIGVAQRGGSHTTGRGLVSQDDRFPNNPATHPDASPIDTAKARSLE